MIRRQVLNSDIPRADMLGYNPPPRSPTMRIGRRGGAGERSICGNNRTKSDRPGVEPAWPKRWAQRSGRRGAPVFGNFQARASSGARHAVRLSRAYYRLHRDRHTVQGAEPGDGDGLAVLGEHHASRVRPGVAGLRVWACSPAGSFSLCCAPGCVAPASARADSFETQVKALGARAV